MRDGTVKLPDVKGLVEEILVEANFFLLDVLVELCKQTLEYNTMENQLGISKKLNILETYDEVLQVTASSDKPILIIYYGAADGIIEHPNNFNLKEFMAKLQSQLDIYFKCVNGYGNRWTFVMYYQNRIEMRSRSDYSGQINTLPNDVQRVLKDISENGGN